MYSSAVLAVALASAASSSLAAPIAPTFHSFIPVNKLPVNLATNKILPARQTQDASGALNTGLAKDIVDIGNGVISGIDGIKNLFNREELELLARQSTDASGALNTGLAKDILDIGNGVISGIDGIKNLFNREELELLSRQSTDASGALNTGLAKDIVDIGNGVINGIDGIKNLFTGSKREEFEALVARQVADNTESGAIKVNTGLVGDIVDIGNGIINGAQGIKNLFTGDNKRDFEDLLARQVQEDQNSGALGLSTIVKVGGALINGISSLFNNKRDFDEALFAREYLDIMARQAASPPDSSGALGLDTIVKVGGALVNGISSLFNNNKREEVSAIFARAAADADASGSLDIGNILKTVAGFILKREEMELLARDAPADGSSQALDIGNILKTVAGFILKREEMELMARDGAAAAPTGSESLDIGNILKTVAGFILKREEEMMARSLNELD